MLRHLRTTLLLCDAHRVLHASVAERTTGHPNSRYFRAVPSAIGSEAPARSVLPLTLSALMAGTKLEKPRAGKASKVVAKRSNDLKLVLTTLRDRVVARIRELRRDQDADVTPLPADEMDVARSLADVETHAGLIERADDSLRSIDDALDRFERGTYGICRGCGDEIPTERLRAMPFATLCIDCQAKTNRAARVGQGTLSRSVRRRWDIPQELDESLETQDSMLAPEEDLAVHRDRPLGPDAGVESMEPETGRRRRGRPRKAVAK